MGALPTLARTRTITLGRSPAPALGALSNSEARLRSNLLPQSNRTTRQATPAGGIFLRYTRTVKRHLALSWIVFVALAFAASAAFGQNNGSVERYAEEGQAALAAGHYADAERTFEKLRQLEPGIAEVHANLGLIYFEERKFEE